MTTSLFSYSPGDDLSNAANRHALETLVLPGLTSTFQTLELTYVGEASAAGKLLGIEFGNSGSGWLGADNVRVSSVAAPPNSIPEPITMLALGLGITGLGGYVRKRRRC